MFEEYITLGQAITVTVLSMAVVIIAFLVIMRGSSKKDKTTANVVQKPQAVVNTVVEDDSELVAVITAAIAAMTGTSASGLVVRNIKRLPDFETAWSKTGKIELMR